MPNVSGSPNRAASSASSPASRMAVSSARSAGSGSSAIHARAVARRSPGGWRVSGPAPLPRVRRGAWSAPAALRSSPPPVEDQWPPRNLPSSVGVLGAQQPPATARCAIAPGATLSTLPTSASGAKNTTQVLGGQEAPSGMGGRHRGLRACTGRAGPAATGKAATGKAARPADWNRPRHGQVTRPGSYWPRSSRQISRASSLIRQYRAAAVPADGLKPGLAAPARQHADHVVRERGAQRGSLDVRGRRCLAGDRLRRVVLKRSACAVAPARWLKASARRPGAGPATARPSR